MGGLSAKWDRYGTALDEPPDEETARAVRFYREKYGEAIKVAQERTVKRNAQQAAMDRDAAAQRRRNNEQGRKKEQAAEANLKTKQDYVEEAFRNVGITKEQYQALLKENAKLEPYDKNKQDLGDVLDIRQRVALMEKIRGAWGKLYQSKPDLFVWSGFAAIAVNDGVLPATKKALSIATRLLSSGPTYWSKEDFGLTWLRAYDAGLGILRVDDNILQMLTHVKGITAYGSGVDGAKSAFLVNFLIYEDLAWAHLAYKKGGLAELERINKAEPGGVAPQIMEGFRLIDQGRKMLEAKPGDKEGLALIAKGNVLLFRQEQENSATPGFQRFTKTMEVATNLGRVIVPNRLLRETATGMGNKINFSEAYPGISYGPFKERWAWLEKVGWGAYYEAYSKKREALDKEVQRAIDGKSE